MKSIFSIILITVLTVGAILGGLLGRGTAAFSADDKPRTPIEKVRGDYTEAVRIIGENYAGAVDFEKVTEDSIQGMLYALDPHSAFFTRAEFDKLQQEQSSQFYGIGVSIVRHRDGVYVQSLVKGAPATRAGMRYGDRIVEIDGADARELTSAEVSKRVRGERNVAVRLKVERAGVAQPVAVEIVRNAVPFPSIRNAFMVRPGVGYVALTGGFQGTTNEELGEAIDNLREQGMKQLLLDLRFNPGGLLPQALDVSSRFIDRGLVITSVRGRSRFASTAEYKSSGGDAQNLPLVVLINNSSASASEIVAGAVQDHARGLVVGESSFGKGLVQRVFNTPFGTGLTLTTARYYTPYGRSLQRDYSAGSIYDYYTRHSATRNPAASPSPSGEATPLPTPAGAPVTTAGGRVFYNGGGVEPDVKVAPLEFNQVRARALEAAFYFTRQLAAGQIRGLENYRVERTTFDHELRPTDFPITDRVLEAFREFVAADPVHGLTAPQINADAEFIRVQLREEIVSAAYAAETGQRVLLDADPQVLKAIESLPEAKKLADGVNAARLYQN